MSAVDQAVPAEPTRKRILIGTDTYPPDVNGAAYFTARLAEGLSARGNDVHVVCPSPDGPPRIERRNGVTLHRVRSASVLVHPTMRTALPLGLAGTLRRLLDRFAPHVIHAQGHFVIGRTLISAGRRNGTPVVLTNHFMPENLFHYAHVPGPLQGPTGGLAWRDFVRVMGTVDHVTTPTAKAARLLLDKGFGHPVEAVSCGIDLSRFHPRPERGAKARAMLGLPERETVMFVGRLDDEKRIDDMVRALPMIAKVRDAQLALVGTGSRRAALEQLAASLGVADRVRFLGFVPDDELPMAYQAADVFGIASIAELQSIATLEAMASGLPVVAADAMALPHLVDEDRNGYLYPPGDHGAFAHRVLSILESGPKRAAMAEASLEIARRHDHERSLARFEEIYDTVRPGVGIDRRRRRVAVSSGSPVVVERARARELTR
ncbi:glycosyltransferase [Allonocardiopsis opalescens]|nr:glycosyltransferase [Allonocardiopsis opalescens]